MALIARFWATVTYVMSFLTFSDLRPGSIAQHPLSIFPPHAPDTFVKPIPDHPHFKPPAGNRSDTDFKCDYTAMKGWYPCSEPTNRECWLRHPNGSEFNIHTNYEIIAPIGIDRYYTLDITDSWFNPDGVNSTEAKLFNDMYPGPWIQACWGDRIHVTVNNHMLWNGTSIHWHGIRQLNSMQMDGVNGVTQCPIARGDSFTYSFNTTQYGSSWYHSHYSVQYADGLQGPITIHGPVSASFDEAVDPIILTDWGTFLVWGDTFLADLHKDKLTPMTTGHNSAFQTVYNKSWMQKPSILLNGRGNVTRFINTTAPELKVPPIYDIAFTKQDYKYPKKYLLRIINTSFDTTFIFSIDNHWLQMVSADFVPIEPYYNTSLLIGIGQRYNVIVEARPDAGAVNPIPGDGNFWIRTWTADGCNSATGTKGYELNGILRYDNTSDADPTSREWPDIAKKCSDESRHSLRPKLPWTVGKNANNQTNPNGDIAKLHAGNVNVTHEYPLATFKFDVNKEANMPLRVDFNETTFEYLGDKGHQWNPNWAVVPADYQDDDWVYLILTANGNASTFGAHPIHLHGHDFAILQQVEDQPYNPSLLDLNEKALRNPARRDVALLPNKGFLVIAFKSDNPGSWLLHCHIAFHASRGLGFQVLERQEAAAARWPMDGPAQIENARVCENWKDWQKDCKNWWPGFNVTTQSYPACDKLHVFQDDSGV